MHIHTLLPDLSAGINDREDILTASFSAHTVNAKQGRPTVYFALETIEWESIAKFKCNKKKQEKKQLKVLMPDFMTLYT